MACYYAFNGDADGLCALQQLRLVNPGESTLITGVKRDIQLLERVPAVDGDVIYALDVSLDTNRDGLLRVLDAGAEVRYFDHHNAGDIPARPSLISHIDLAPDVCTSLLVDRHLKGRYRMWAITAAFGDSLPEVARSLASAEGLSASDTETLERLGVCLNYNAYGETIDDLHFDPAHLAAEMLPFEDPRAFAEQSPACARLFAGYQEDMAHARSLTPFRSCHGASILVLPAEAWARRAIGVLANELMLKSPSDAFALLSPNAGGDYTVSVRVPATTQTGAGDFCRTFDTGGGRRSAGGINRLPSSDIESFAERFEAQYGSLAQ
jgi:hypothetical protein